MDKIVSKDYNLHKIIKEEISFNIPRYQRLFVWKEEQINTLFNDILTAAFSNKNFYYIGGIITVKYDNIENCYDLVDGQQRFTTLWLLCNELGDDLDSFTKRRDDLRLNFSIRDNVKDFFNKILNEKEVDTKKTDFEDLIRISKAKRTLNSLIKQNLNTKDKKQKFAEFILNRLKMVITNVPSDTDLNKLFETLNNRGIQLSQHEILKAQLLAQIPNKNTRNTYNTLWSACSDMDDYLERNLAKEIKSMRNVSNTYGWDNNLRLNDIKKLIKISSNNKTKELKLQEIITAKKDFQLSKDGNPEIFHEEATSEEYEKTRGILTFPQLLLHTLRIYLYNKELKDIQRINEKELLEIFGNYYFTSNHKEEQEENSKKFIDLLLKVREAFDKYVIRWVEIDENIEVHLIKKIIKRNRVYKSPIWYLVREKTSEYDGLAILQSILYHSQQNTTQYWLTPFLNYVIGHPTFDEAFNDLKKTDNILFCGKWDDENLPQRTWACMEDYPEIELSCELLKEKLGVDFPHYWFYKLEFILWHNRIELGKKDEWESYKMTARNSVEHISPQNPRNASDKLCKTELDGFGNLVLVTRSINSEYSDLPYSVKKAKFDDKKSKGSLDALKSDLIYSYPNWNDEMAKDHEKDMKELVENYFNEVSNE
jgi:hypothetical protein